MKFQRHNSVLHKVILLLFFYNFSILETCDFSGYKVIATLDIKIQGHVKFFLRLDIFFFIRLPLNSNQNLLLAISWIKTFLCLFVILRHYCTKSLILSYLSLKHHKKG